MIEAKLALRAVENGLDGLQIRFVETFYLAGPPESHGIPK